MDDGTDGWKASRKMDDGTNGWKKASRKRTTTSFNICNLANDVNVTTVIIAYGWIYMATNITQMLKY